MKRIILVLVLLTMLVVGVFAEGFTTPEKLDGEDWVTWGEGEKVSFIMGVLAGVYQASLAYDLNSTVPLCTSYQIILILTTLDEFYVENPEMRYLTLMRAICIAWTSDKVILSFTRGSGD